MFDRPLLWLRMADCCMPLLQPQPHLHPTTEAAAEARAVATSIGEDLHSYRSSRPQPTNLLPIELQISSTNSSMLSLKQSSPCFSAMQKQISVAMHNNSVRRLFTLYWLVCLHVTVSQAYLLPGYHHCCVSLHVALAPFMTAALALFKSEMQRIVPLNCACKLHSRDGLRSFKMQQLQPQAVLLLGYTLRLILPA